MRTKRISRQWMYILSFIACILVVNLGDMIISHADEVDIAVKYRTYTNESGWQDDAQQGGDNAAGSTEALTGVKMMVVIGDNDTVSGNVKYSVFSKEGNWSETVEAGSKATSGDNPIKAIKVELTDAIANEYDIEYRTCNSNNEWLTWSKNGEVAGNVDGDANLVAIQAKIVKKVVTQETNTDDTNTGVITPGSDTTPGDNTQPTTPAAGNEAMEAFVAKVVSQMGQGRNEAGNTTYGEWWASRVNNSAFKDAAWCAMFLSWCANEAGISENTIGYYAACSYWQDFYKNAGRWHARDGYTPVKGDLIFFDYTGDGVANHNGVVESVNGSQVVAVEGNVSDKVDRVTYKLSDSKIVGYGSPEYEKNAENVAADNAAAQQSGGEETGSTGGTTTGQAGKMIEVAASQIGTHETSRGWTKYGQWYQDNIDGSWNFSTAHWCAMFVTWCAKEVGVSRDVIKPYASCSVGVSNFKNQGVWHSRSSGYTPKTGDIIFFTYSHTGIVEKVEDGYVHTIEGNTSDQCKRRQHAIGSSKIKGYGSPNYN